MAVCITPQTQIYNSEVYDDSLNISMAESGDTLEADLNYIRSVIRTLHGNTGTSGNWYTFLNRHSFPEIIAELDALTTNVTSHTHSLGQLSNVVLETTVASGEILRWNGSNWVNNTRAEAGIADRVHTHLKADITDFSHTHAISEITNLQTTLNGKVDENAAITGATATKITFDSKGLVTSGTSLAASDIPALAASKITSGTLIANRGGTGISSYTANNYIRAFDANTLEQRTPAQVRSDIGASAAGHTHALGALSNVVLTSPANGQALVYDFANSVWINGGAAGGGGDADTLDTLDSTQFLRSDTSDSYTSGTLSFSSGTTISMNDGATLLIPAKST